MDFFPMSLPEAAFFYMGLAIQTLTRSAFVILPRIIVSVNIVRLLSFLPANRERFHLWPVITYVLISMGILIVFWPETILFAGNTAASNAVTPAQVKSFAASQGGGSLVNAGQTGLVPASLNGTSLTPKGTALILEVLTETPLGLARLINSQAHRPFASIVPMMWLFTRKVTPRLKLAIQDFVHACYLPAKARLIANSTTNPTFQDLLPWDGSPIVAAMRNHEVLRSHQLGIPAFGGAIPQELITCDTYAAQVQQDALAWLNTEQTESGTPLSDVYQNELQMDPLTVARYAIYREMLAAAGPEIPSPSLTGTFLALRGASVVGRIMGGAFGGVSGRSGASPSTGLKGGGIGAVVGLGRGIGNEIQQLIDGITTFLRPAIFLTWWAPYIFGIINMVLLALFPLVLLWSLTPGQQFRPILLYFALLFVTSSTPLWWALVDVAARLGGSLDLNMMAAVPQWLEAAAARLVITVVGIFVVLATMAVMVLWTGFAAVRGIFRAAVA